MTTYKRNKLLNLVVELEHHLSSYPGFIKTGDSLKYKRPSTRKRRSNFEEYLDDLLIDYYLLSIAQSINKINEFLVEKTN